MEQSKVIDWKALFKKERLPAVVVDLNAFDRNVEKLRNLTQSIDPKKKIRIASKSVRVPVLMKRVLESSDQFQGLMCYSAEEIGFLSNLKGFVFDDFLLAYPTLQNSDLKILQSVHENRKTIKIVVDSVQHLQALSKFFVDSQNPLQVLIDVDLSLRFFRGWLHIGVRRSSIRTTEQAVLLAKEIARYPGLIFSGFMAYEAQVAGLGDRNPFKSILNPLARWVRKMSVQYIQKRRTELLIEFNKNKFNIKIFNGGGTGSFNYALQESVLTEVTAGSALLCPHLFDYYSNVQFEPACYFALQAVRSSDPGYVTAQGGGYIASGEAGKDRLPVPIWPENLALIDMEGAGEVQTPVKGVGTSNVEVGGPIVFRHAKAGELAERFNEYLLIADGQIIAREKTYRGYGMSFF